MPFTAEVQRFLKAVSNKHPGAILTFAAAIAKAHDTIPCISLSIFNHGKDIRLSGHSVAEVKEKFNNL
jgi:hypothetical protein